MKFDNSRMLAILIVIIMFLCLFPQPTRAVNTADQISVCQVQVPAIRVNQAAFIAAEMPQVINDKTIYIFDTRPRDAYQSEKYNIKIVYNTSDMAGALDYYWNVGHQLRWHYLRE